MRKLRDGTTTFLRPNGTEIEAAPALPVPLTRLATSQLRPDDIPVWDGTPFDLVYAIDVLYEPRASSPERNGHARVLSA